MPIRRSGVKGYMMISGPWARPSLQLGSECSRLARRSAFSLPRRAVELRVPPSAPSAFLALPPSAGLAPPGRRAPPSRGRPPSARRSAFPARPYARGRCAPRLHSGRSAAAAPRAAGSPSTALRPTGASAASAPRPSRRRAAPLRGRAFDGRGHANREHPGGERHLADRCADRRGLASPCRPRHQRSGEDARPLMPPPGPPGGPGGRPRPDHAEQPSAPRRRRCAVVTVPPPDAWGDGLCRARPRVVFAPPGAAPRASPP